VKALRRIEPNTSSPTSPNIRLLVHRNAALIRSRWADDVRLSDLEPRIVCKACGAD
jgi:hypothetical protein